MSKRILGRAGSKMGWTSGCYCMCGRIGSNCSWGEQKKSTLGSIERGDNSDSKHRRGFTILKRGGEGAAKGQSVRDGARGDTEKKSEGQCRGKVPISPAGYWNCASSWEKTSKEGR